MNNEMTEKRITEWRQTELRSIGRPSLRLGCDVRADQVKIMVETWSSIAMDTKTCKRIFEQAGNHKQL
jgi:hypothetical protein